MLEFIGYLDRVFAERYAPAEFKAERFGWERTTEVARLKKAVISNPRLSDEQFRRLVRVFFLSMRDIHTGVSFDRNSAVWLGLHFRTVGEKVLIAWIDRGALPQTAFPFQVGDELISFGGRSPSVAIASVAQQTGWRSTPDFDRSFAEWFLVVRSRSEWPSVPAPGAQVELQIREKGKSAPVTHSLTWLDMEARAPTARCPFWGKTKSGWVPQLGDPKWRGGERFTAYAFRDAGQLIGYIRIPSYAFKPMDSVKAMAEFDATIDSFNELGIEKLILDQTGNAGGNFLFGFALMSKLTASVLKPPLQHYMITSTGEIVGFGKRATLAGMLKQAEGVRTEAAAREYMAKSPVFTGGMRFAPKELSTVQMFRDFVRVLVEHPTPAQGSTLTKLHFAVQDRIAPRSTAKGGRFTGPMVVLIDELNISAAEYVAAAYKDNGRARLVGVRTSGAGGDQRVVHRDRVCSESAPRSPFVPCVPASVSVVMRDLGITSFRYTISLGYRVKPSGEVIAPFENTGVAPDVEVLITASDIADGFKAYRDRVLAVVREAE